MSRATKNIGTGVKMLAGGKGAPFTLEFLTDTHTHSVNSSQVVVVPYIEIGRDKACGIRFGEDTPMVSRKHASLERKGQRVAILNLSATNQTLVNGRPVNKEWLLNNGDEIQLSADGPRIRFINAAGKTPMAFTAKMKLFAQQSLRPYRYALLGLLVLFVVAVGVGAFLLHRVNADKDHLREVAQTIQVQLQEQEKARAEGDAVALAERAKLAEELAVANRQNESFQQSLAAQSKVLKALTRPEPRKVPAANASVATRPAPSGPDRAIMGNRSFVYALQILLTVKDKNGEALELADENQQPVKIKDYLVGTGTGFVLEDGRFVTVRRWVEPWAYPKDEKDMLNLYANFVHQNGGTATVKLVATAPGGQELTLHGHQFTVNRLADHPVVGNFGFGEGKIAVADPESGTDWAMYKVPIVGLAFGAKEAPAAGTELHLLGYEIPAGAQNGPAGNPTYTRRAFTGVDKANGNWTIGDGGVEPGNYGGPAFVLQDGIPFVAGMLTSGPGGKPTIIPINRLTNK